MSWSQVGFGARLIVGDCIEVLPTLDAESVHLTVFSPPYDGIRDYKDGFDGLDLVALGRELLRVTVPGGVVAMVIGDGTKNFRKSLTTARTQVEWVDLGWHLFECNIYRRDGRPGAWWNKRFRVDHEYILIFFKGDRPRYFDKSHLAVAAKHAGKVFTGTQRLTSGETVVIEPTRQAETKCRGTVWTYASSNTEGNKLKLEHPATMPDALARDLILAFSREGDVVLDPTAGSGTTARMALETERETIAIELSDEYADIIRQLVPSIVE